MNKFLPLLKQFLHFCIVKVNYYCERVALIGLR